MEGKACPQKVRPRPYNKKTEQQESAGAQSGEPAFLVWLRGWRQVLIGELLHVLDRRSQRNAQ